MIESYIIYCALSTDPNTILNIATLMTIPGNFLVQYLIFPFKRSTRFSISMIILITVILFWGSDLLHIEVSVVTNLVRGILMILLHLFLFQGELFQKLFASILNFMMAAFLAAISLEIATIFATYESYGFYIYFIFIYFIIYAGYIASVLIFWRRIFKMLFVNERKSLWALYTLGAMFSFAVLTTLRITLQTGPIYTLMILFVFFSYIVMC